MLGTGRSSHRPVRCGCSIMPRVSIHAPVRGATVDDAQRVGRVVVSIHAPVRGATRHGGRHPALPAVSIHAPVRGAPGPGVALGVPPCFDPRPRAGGTTRDSQPRPNVEFRSTPPCGGHRSHPNFLLQAEKVGLPREPSSCTSYLKRRPIPVRRTSPMFTMLKTAREPARHAVRAWGSQRSARDHTISGPSRSCAGFAPTCSTRRRPSAPRR